VGIDPGKSGALVVLQQGSIVDQHLLSHISPKHYLDKLKNIQAIFIEKAQTMGRENARAMFSYGHAYGYLCGSLIDIPAKVYYVPPVTWTSKIHALSPIKYDNPKECSLFVAKKIWPTHDFRATERSKKPHDGIIDAALIALYGWQWLKNSYEAHK